MKSSWPLVRFDKILSRVDRRLEIDDVRDYDCVGVRLYGRGAFVRERLAGSEIKRKQQWVIRSDDVVYNKLFAWKGTFAIAQDVVDGCIVSDNFPTYRADQDLVDTSYLKWFFRTETIRTQALRLSKGAAAISKLTLNPPQFWDLVIPLPPLKEQRQIVAKIENFDMKAEEAQQLRTISDRKTADFIKSAINQLTELFAEHVPLGGFLERKPRNGWSARCDNAPDGVSVLALSRCNRISDIVSLNSKQHR